jgi:hypothetical protein
VVDGGGNVDGVVDGVAPLVLVVVWFGGPAAGWLLQAARRDPVATSSTADRESRRANDGRTVSMAFSIAGRPPEMMEGRPGRASSVVAAGRPMHADPLVVAWMV